MLSLLALRLTLSKDLTVGIVAGCALAALFAVFKREISEEGV